MGAAAALLSHLTTDRKGSGWSESQGNREEASGVGRKKM